MIKSIGIWLFLLLVIVSEGSASGLSASKESKNLLLINSYHQGLAWTDSLTSVILSITRQHPDINLNIEYLNSKQFGNSNFEAEKNYIRNKYAGISFDGIIVTDNDALDFAILYDEYLFPNRPIVFAGISNPEDYNLEGTQIYGFKETSNTDYLLGFVKQILPKAKKLFLLADFTTTGLIYRTNLKNQAAQWTDFNVVFPEEIDQDKIYQYVREENDLDAIYFVGINQDKYGKLVDSETLYDSIIQLAKVPVFSNDLVFNGRGVIGGLYQSGKKHGMAAARLSLQLIDSKNPKPDKHYGTTEYNYFFDQKILDKFDIPKSRLPAGAKVINDISFPNKKYFFGLISVLAFLLFIVFHLFLTVRNTKKTEQKIRSQFKQIENQNKELEAAYGQLGGAISQLEMTNDQLNNTNKNLREAKKKAEESDNLKSAFLANVSHEIRTPLNSIVGFSSLLIEPDLDEETRNSYAGLIESNTESLLVLIDDIIDLSKIEAQQLTIKKQEFSVDDLMLELFRIFNHSNQNPRVELKMERIPEDKVLLVNSDRVRVKQVFTNLISNAFKFTDSGFIKLGCFEAENREIILFVKDSGIGISKEYFDTVFERFRKLNVGGNKVYRGTGLGLSITKKLVELLGGQIWIDSEPGVGTAFYFTLDGLKFRDVKA
ncbi:MAG: hypothetical protein JZU47_00640 [Prolixibacteraceae bacterium]|nr:hypothetical protein [Prolixibacteraceae bacterium]